MVFAFNKAWIVRWKELQECSFKNIFLRGYPEKYFISIDQKQSSKSIRLVIESATKKHWIRYLLVHVLSKKLKNKSIYSIKQTTRRPLIKGLFKSSVSLLLLFILILQIKNFLRHFMMVVMALNPFFFLFGQHFWFKKKCCSILLISNKNLWNSLICIDFLKVCSLYKVLV